MSGGAEPPGGRAPSHLSHGSLRSRSSPSSLRDLYDEALELPADARERFVAALEAAGNPHCAHLRRLLAAADPSAESPLDADPWARIEVEGPEPAPERIGAYRILSELGRGGMGRVYLAEQEGADFRRKVALKVVAPEGAGAAEIDRRFRDERRILAGLEHPGIARLYDAGRSEDGRWYLALEYVAGANLVDHARENRLSVGERVQLFLAVLEAVAFAHAASIVHRDLKPANIQIGADGKPRLLDFGIAKFVDGGQGESAASASMTRTGVRALTPAYASPEQFRGEPVTPASDVFSLGIVLYELLTGRRPFATEGTQIAMEHAILTEDPVPPSTALRRSTSAARAAEPQPEGRPRRRRLSRDLDAICLKALAKDPRARYATAAEFAADVSLYLSGLPVGARGGGFTYRLSRQYRRHQPAFMAAAILLVALAPLLYVEAVRRTPPPASTVEPPPRKFPFSGVAAGDAAELERRFAAEPGSLETGAHLAIALEKGGRRPEAELIVARLRQIPERAADPLIDYVEATLAMSGGEPQRALILLTTALERALAEGRGDLVSQTRASRGRLLSTLGRSAEARADMVAARAGFEASGDHASLARVLNDLSVEELQRGDLAAGEQLLEEALVASRAAGPGGGGVILGNLAGIAVQRGRPDLAEPRYREAVEIFRESKSRRLSWALTDLSEALRDLGRVQEADAALAESIELLGGGPAGSDLGIALSFRGGAELEAGELDRVVKTIAELTAVARSSGDRPALAFAGRLRGRVAAARGDPATARREIQEASRMLRDNGQADWAAETDLMLAEVHFGNGDLAAAAEVAQRLPGVDESAGSGSTTSFLASALLVGIEARSGATVAARRRFARLDGDAAESPSIGRRIGFLLSRARLAHAEGRDEESRRDLAAALASAETAGRKLRGEEIRRELAALLRR